MRGALGRIYPALQSQRGALAIVPDFLPHLLPPPRNEEGLQSIIKSCHLTDATQVLAHLLSINLCRASTVACGMALFCAFEAWSTPLIPVLVTGIEPTRVYAARRVLSAQGLGLTRFL